VRDLPSVGGMAKPSVEAVLALKPDLVLATTEGNPPAVVERLNRLGVPAYTVDRDSTGMEGIFESVLRVGDVLSVPTKAKALVEASRLRLPGLGVPRAQDNVPVRALLLVWTRPPITAGRKTYLHDLLEAAGATNAASDLEGDWPRLSREALVSLRPEVVLVANDMSGEEPPGLEELQATPGLRARFVRVSGDPLLRPSPAAIDALEELRCALRPDSCGNAP